MADGRYRLFSQVDVKRADGSRQQVPETTYWPTRKECEEHHQQRLYDAQRGRIENKRDRKAREQREREEAERERERVEHEKKKAETETVWALLDAWFEEHRRGLEGATAQRYGGAIRNLKRLLPPDANVREFTALDGRKLFLEYARHGGVNGGPQLRSSVMQAKACLSQAFGKAALHGIIPVNPLKSMGKLPLKKSAKRKPPGVADHRRLIAASAADPHLAVPVAFAIGLGLRRGEVLGVAWGDIDFEKAKLSVRHSVEEFGKTIQLKTPKTEDSERSIALPDIVVATLHAHRQRQREWMLQCGAGYDRTLDLVNPAPDGKLWRPSTFTDVYLAFARSLGIPGTYHDLRHSHGTELTAFGVDSTSVSARLGHSDVKFTMSTYVHAVPESDRRAAAAIDAILLGPAEESANEGRP